MKNRKAKKTCSSTKKNSNAKIAVTILLVFVLICGAVVGTIAAISDGFTKPVEDWFSDKATVTPGDQTGDDQGDQTTPGGNDQGDQTGDEVVVCEHVFEYGVCTKCGDRAADVLQMATKVVAPDEDCVVNYWTIDYELIKTDVCKGGDYFSGIEGYSEYFLLSPAKINTNVENTDKADSSSVLINGNIFPLEYMSFAMLYPRIEGNKIYFNNIPDDIIAYLNGKIICGSKSNISSTVPPFINVGDEFEFLAGGSKSLYISDGLFLQYFETDPESNNLSYGLDIVNVIVLNYEITE